MSSIPFVIGITGHRDLRREDIPMLTQLIHDQFAAWIRLYPNTDFFCMTSLAEGADQLCGRIAFDMGIHLLVPLPMEQAEYEKDFSDAVLEEFRTLLHHATSVFVASDIEMQHDATRKYAYRQAGIYVVRHCHVLLALWDGLPGDSGCCGTAETVSFKTMRSYCTPDSMLNTPTEGIVLQIVTPRHSHTVIPESALSVRLIEHTCGALRELLEGTDVFNKDAKAVDASKSICFLDAPVMQSIGQLAEPLQILYQLADELALKFRNKYLLILKWLCATGMLLILSFLFYDEFEANLFLIVYGLIASASLALFLYAKHGHCHRKYIEYRLFAETLRVQLNLLASGLAISVEELMPWSQRTICPWIRSVMSSLPFNGQPSLCAPSDAQKIWIEAQLNYQKTTYKINSAKKKRQSKISIALLVFTILFFTTVLLLEFFFPVWIGQDILLPNWFCQLTLIHSDQFFNVRSIFKILLSIIPAFTLIVSSYYGKLSLERKLRDGSRMIALYSEALMVYDNPAVDKAQLLKELAKEELVETGGWLSYVSENPPDICL